MTITQVNEIWQGRDGSANVRGATTYSRHFRVLTNSNYDTVVEATATGTPKIGDLFPSDSNAYCQSLNGRQEPFSPRVWIITAGYSTEREIQDNPLADPTVITWGTEQFQRPFYKDRNGDAILNSAGDPFDPPTEGDDSRLSVTMVRNLAVVPGWILQTKDKVNSVAFVIDGITIPIELAKIQRVSVGKQETRNLTSFRVVSVVITIQDVSWQKQILDAGFQEITGSNRKKILDNDGAEVTSPAPLDGAGAKLSNPTPSTAVFKDFDIYDTFDFSILPF